ncbi:MAG: hypothetical protein Q7S16_00190 [bacterium]|nr:hypothetical protein [bacterium]
MMTPESPRHIEQNKKVISVEEAVRRIRMLANLREKKKNKEPLDEKEKQLLPALEGNVDAWLGERLSLLAISPREMPRRVAQWIYEGAQKNEEQKGYQESEWQWLKEEKKKPEAARDPAYTDRLSVFCILIEDAALARKWMVEQHKIIDDKDASPLKRVKARDALKITGRELDTLKESKAPPVEAWVPVRSEKKETTTTRIADVWHKIIQHIEWPADMPHNLREQIGRRYAAQEEELARVVGKERNKEEAVTLFDKLALGLRVVVAQKSDACKEVVESILREVKTHVDMLSDASDVGKGLATMKESPVYLNLLSRFQKLLIPRDRFHAQRFIRETMYPRLKMVYNGTVPEEAYDRLIAELEAKVQVLHDDYDANKARIVRDAARRRHIVHQKRKAS